MNLQRFCLRAFLLVAIVAAMAPGAMAQSTGTIQGVVTDASGAVVPNAEITVRNQGTGATRTEHSDSAGIYVAASLDLGTYSVQAKAAGFQAINATGIVLNVGQTVTQDFHLKVSSTSEVVEVTGSLPVIDSTNVGIGSVVNQQTVQEIPLNGRHFVDLALLTVGTVTPPANGFLTAPLRGQGSFAFNSAGAREDEINYMINGINMSDPVQNQITFQPTINTVQEFEIDNSTYSAEYGRNAGSIVNIATRQGTNQWHGELYEYVRNSYFDARNFTNPTYTGTPPNQTPNHQAPFIRNQFGGDGGGAVIKDKLFFYVSYEGLRQRQAVPLPTVTVLSSAQRAQALASGDSAVIGLTNLIPLPNGPSNTYVSSAVANVDIDQGTGNLSYVFSDSHRINAYYALQRDVRGEPPTTDANNLPGYGDLRQGKRQIFTFNDVKVFNSNWVNEARLGYNRIHIIFNPDNTQPANSYGINGGVTADVGLPQIEITNGPFFGGISGFPQGRGDLSTELSDTVSWTHGKHSVKFGGEWRRINNNNFTYTPGIFAFSSIASFLTDTVSSFSTTNSNRSNREFVNSVGAFVTDHYKMSPRLTLDLGFRWDWYGSPAEGEGRYVSFIPQTVSLVQDGTNGTPSSPYQQNFMWQPRVGFAYDLTGKGTTVIRSAYAIMGDQPITGIVTGLAANPPFAFPVSSTAAGLTMLNAFTLAGGSVSPYSIVHNYHDAYVQEWNFNIQHKLATGLALMAGYYASKGTDLNIERNYNQFIDSFSPTGVLSTVRPFPKLSASSPIDPGVALTNITVAESDGNSSYNGLWTTLTKRFQQGLQFDSTFTWSKSIDDVSQNNHGVTVQDSNNLRGDRGLSDFNAATRFTLDGIYTLPFKRNRLVSGWQLSTIIQLQSGNPLNFHTSNASFTGNANLRPSITGPIDTGFTPATNDSATTITYIQDPSAFVQSGNANQFGNLGRNAIIGPGFTNVDFALEKNTKITERFTWQIRFEAFDLLNVANFNNPVSTISSSTVSGLQVLTSTPTLGLISAGTRFTSGDFGSSRQIQLSMKLIF
jgi:hypothetical protein